MREGSGLENRGKKRGTELKIKDLNIANSGVCGAGSSWGPDENEKKGEAFWAPSISDGDVRPEGKKGSSKEESVRFVAEIFVGDVLNDCASSAAMSPHFPLKSS